jgi:tetratricopeptide (TPR) repeat protein
MINACKPAEGEKKSDVSLTEQIRKERMAHEQKVYAEAMKAGDSYAALHAAYSLLADDSAHAVQHLDTIVSLYASLSLIEPAFKTADRILAIDPQNDRMLDIKAAGEIAKGNGVEVIKKYRALYDKTNDLNYLFKVGQVQVQVSDPKDLKNTISEFENHPKLSTDSVDSQVGTGIKKQKVTAKAALVYLRGLEAVRAQNYALAKKHMGEALKLQPDFFMAKQFLEDLNRPVQPRQ